MMKTIVTAQDIYDYRDLDKDIQENVLHDLWDINVDSQWWHEHIVEHWEERLNKIGFYNPKVYFSGFYSQGDGACFSAGIEITVDLFEQFVKQLHDKELLKMISKHKNWFFDFLTENCNFNIEKTDLANRYSHKKTRYIAGHIENDTIKSGYLEQCFDQFLAFIEDVRLEMCQEIYSELQQEYKDLTSDAAIIETIDGNEYQFAANGRIHL